MPRQRAIRFPDDLHALVEAKAQRLGHPHTFSSVIVNAARRDVEGPAKSNAEAFVSSVVRGSPSPSVERAKRSIT